MSRLSFISILRYFFWSSMLFPYLPLQILLSNIFTKKPSIWFIFGRWPEKCLITPKTFWTNYAPLFQAWWLVFPRNFLIFEMFMKLLLMYWGRVKMVDMALKIGVSFKCVRYVDLVLWNSKTKYICSFKFQKNDLIPIVFLLL